MTSRKSANLLLVDDDPSLLKLLGMRLSSEGFKVITAESGMEALKLLQKEKVDLVISDLRMDEMDGMALFDEVQKHHPNLPVIILTAHGSIPDAVAATQRGYLVFSLSLLIKMHCIKRLMTHWHCLQHRSVMKSGARGL